MTGQGSEAFGQRDGGGSEPITYYNCLASERSERGAPVRHPSSRRMASLPITSAVIANFSRPCLLLACPPPRTLPSTTLFVIADDRIACCWRYLFVLISFEEVTTSGRTFVIATPSESRGTMFLNGKAGVIDVNPMRPRMKRLYYHPCHFSNLKCAIEIKI